MRKAIITIGAFVVLILLIVFGNSIIQKELARNDFISKLSTKDLYNNSTIIEQKVTEDYIIFSFTSKKGDNWYSGSYLYESTAWGGFEFNQGGQSSELINIQKIEHGSNNYFVLVTGHLTSYIDKEIEVIINDEVVTRTEMNALTNIHYEINQIDISNIIVEVNIYDSSGDLVEQYYS